MGKFLAVFPAFLKMLAGYQLFRVSADAGDGPLLSMYIFLTALFLLLYDIRLYPKQFRKLEGPCQTLIEFLIAAFLMENIVMDFWFTLESAITSDVLSRTVELVEDALKQRDWNCDTFCDVLRSKSITMILSYCLSLFFLIAVLHAIRAIDLRALQDGPSCFFEDISYRLKRFFRKKMKALGFSGKRRVKIRESTEQFNKSAKVRNHTPDDQFTNEKCHNETNYGNNNMEETDVTREDSYHHFRDDSCSDFDMAGYDDL